jgi:hypothetical protein
MNISEWEDAVERDPLGLRLSTLEYPSPSPELRSRVLWGTRAIRRPRIPGKRVVFATVGLVLALSTVAATPVGRTVARAVLPYALQQRLGFLIGTPVQPPSAGASATVPIYDTDTRALFMSGLPAYSPADVQKKVNFTISTPTRLPGGIHFRRAMVNPAHTLVYLHYADASGRRTIDLGIQQGPPIGGTEVPSSLVQSAQVNGTDGYYVHGAYARSPSTSGTRQKWNSAADTAELTWRRSGITYNLRCSGLNLSKRDMVQIAESVR